MSRHALPVLLFLGHAAMVSALTAVLVVLTGASRQPHASGHSPAGPVVASPSDRSRPAPVAWLGRLEGNEASLLRDGARLPRSEPVSDDAPEAPAAPPPPDDDAPAAATAPAQAAVQGRVDGAPDAAAAPPVVMQPPADDQVAALNRLVAQSRQESEQLGRIDEQLTAERQRAADDDSRQQGEADQKAAQRAAILAALGTLRQAEAQLAGGNSDDVDDELSSAVAALSGRTRLDVQAAREALARGDLFEAGQYLAVAMAERRARR
jgi:hypothetical protein